MSMPVHVSSATVQSPILSFSLTTGRAKQKALKKGKKVDETRVSTAVFGCVCNVNLAIHLKKEAALEVTET